jgi:hypothetical protein
VWDWAKKHPKYPSLIPILCGSLKQVIEEPNATLHHALEQTGEEANMIGP